MPDSIQYVLGQINAKLDSIKEKTDSNEKKLDVVIERLQKVETKAMVNGGISAGVVSVGFTLLKQTLLP